MDNTNYNDVTTILETKNLTKVYKEQKAVNHVNMHIERGDVYGFVGENGAGKTTLLDAIGGIASSDNKITWLEKYTDLDQNNGEPRNEVAWCANNRYFPEQWSMKNVKRPFIVSARLPARINLWFFLNLMVMVTLQVPLNSLG